MVIPFTLNPKILVSHLWFESLCGSNHLLDTLQWRNYASEFLLCIGFLKSLVQIICLAVTELLNGINSSSLQKL